MKFKVMKIRELLSQGPTTHLDIDGDDTLHLLISPVTIHLDKLSAVELTTTLSGGLVKLLRTKHQTSKPILRLVTPNDGLHIDSSL